MALAQQNWSHLPTQPSRAKRKRDGIVPACSAAAPIDDNVRMGYSLRSRKRCRRTTFSTRSVLPPPPESSESIPPTESLSNAPSPALRNLESKAPSRSVQWGENDDSDQRRILPGQYSTQSPKPPLKTVLKHRELKAANMPSLFEENTPIVAASVAVDNVLCDLCICVKKFKCPSGLDFSANTKSPFILANVEKNKVFINQLHKLNELGTRLAGIPTYENALLMDKHKVAGAAIERTLQRMKEYQLKLYEKFTKEVESALANFAIDLIEACVDNFTLPSELDFAANSEDHPVLRNTERNQPFINCLRRLAWFQEALDNIPEHGDQQLQAKRRSINMAMKQCRQNMKEHQLNLYRLQHTRAH